MARIPADPSPDETAANVEKWASLVAYLSAQLSVLRQRIEHGERSKVRAGLSDGERERRARSLSDAKDLEGWLRPRLRLHTRKVQKAGGLDALRRLRDDYVLKNDGDQAMRDANFVVTKYREGDATVDDVATWIVNARILVRGLDQKQADRMGEALRNRDPALVDEIAKALAHPPPTKRKHGGEPAAVRAITAKLVPGCTESQTERARRRGSNADL